MKNIISKSNTNQASDTFEYSQEQKQYKKNTAKLIKGKIKVYNNHSFSKSMNSENLDDETELFMVSERMVLFLKITFLLVILISLLIFLK